MRFKAYLLEQALLEGGHATSKWGTERATKTDIETALRFLEKTIHFSYADLKNNLLGSTELTLLGKKKDSGDVDVAMPLDPSAMKDVHENLLKAVKGEGIFNAGTKVGSYAVPVGGGKKVQVDLMAVSNVDWAKFIYHSEEGAGSSYPGAVRNIVLMTALAHTQEPGKDFALRDEEGKPTVRASRSIKMDTGAERLFKMVKKTKAGAYGKSLEKVDPEEIEARLAELGKKVKFSHDPDIIDDPDRVAALVFGPGVKAKDITSAEKVIAHVKKLKNAAEVLKACKSELERLKLPVPKELA